MSTPTALDIRIEGVDLPGSSCGPSPQRPDGHVGIHVGVQRRGKPGELLGLVRGDAPSAMWSLPSSLTTTEWGFDFKGPYIQGPPRGRFIYLSWGTVDAADGFSLFRRAKLLLEEVPAGVVAEARDRGVLVGRLGLTDAKGNPTCASVGPSAIVWWAADAGAVDETRAAR